MSYYKNISISVGGIEFNASVPPQLMLADEFSPFLIKKDEPKVNITVKVISQPFKFNGNLVHHSAGQIIYRVDDGWIRCFPRYGEEEEVCTCIHLRNNANHTLYINEKDLEIYGIGKNLLSILAGEYMLLQNDCIILHSSVVSYKGRAVLFSGQSGAGKSTQAEIWKRAFNAEIINGDRCVVAKRDNTFFGCGSPYAGSSDIFRQEEAPLAGIIFVSQGKTNMIYPTSKREAFMKIYSQCIVNTWDKTFTKKICDFIDTLIENVPMYSLSCRPEVSAAELVINHLYK